MAEEVHIGRLVAEIALDNSTVQESANEAVAAVKRSSEEINSTHAEYKVITKTEALENVRLILADLGVTGEKAEQIIQKSFSNTVNIENYLLKLEAISEKIEQYQLQLQELADKEKEAQQEWEAMNQAAGKSNNPYISQYSSQIEAVTKNLRQQELQYDRVQNSLDNYVQRAVSAYGRQGEQAEKATQHQKRLNEAMGNRQARRDTLESFNVTSNSLRAVNQLLPDTTGNLNSVISAIRTLRMSVRSGASASLILVQGIVAAVNVAVSLITGAIERYKKEQEELHKKSVQTASDYENSSKSLSNLAEQYQKTVNEMDIYNHSHQDEISIKDSLKSLQQELIDSYGDEAKKIDLVNGSLQEQIQNLKDLSVQKAETLQLDNRTEYNKATDYMNNSRRYHLFSDTKSIYNGDYLRDFQKVQDILNNTNGANAVVNANVRSGTVSYSIAIDVDGKEAEKTIAKIYKDIESLSDISSDVKKRILDSISSAKSKYIDETYQDYKNIIQQWEKAEKVIQSNGESALNTVSAYSLLMDKITSYNSSMFDLASSYKKLSENESLSADIVQSLTDKYPVLAKYINETGDLTFRHGEEVKQVYEEQRKAVVDSITQQRAAMTGKLVDLKLTVDATEEQKQQLADTQKEYDALTVALKIYSSELTDIDYDGLKSDMDKYNESIENLSKTLEEQNKESKNIHSSLSELSSAYDKLNQGQKLDFDTILNLIDKYPKYASQLLNAADNADAQKQAIELLFEAKRNDYILTQQTSIENIKASNKETETIIANLKKQIETYEYKNAVIGGITGGVQVPLLSPKAIEAIQEIQSLEQQIKDSNKEIENYETKIKAIQDIDIGTFKINTSNSGSSSVKSELQKYLDYIDDLKDLDQITLKSEIASYEWALKTYTATADEKHNVDVRLYNARKKLREQEEAVEQERITAYLKQIDNLKDLDQLSIQSEIASYEMVLQKFKLTADQKHDVEVRLYNAQKKLQEQQEASQAEALQKEYDRINRFVERGKLSAKQEIEQLEKIYQKYKLTTEQKIALEDKLYEKKKQLQDEEISSLDKLGDAVVSALKNKYEQQKELEEKRIDESIESWKKWEDETVNAIQGQIDALDELKNVHDEENKREEYENKRQALELQARYEKDDYNRKQIEKQISALDKEESERLFNIQIEEKKKALQAEADNIRQISSENQEKLQSQKDNISETYSKLMSDIALQGEAQKFILESTQEQIVSLINNYAKDYEMLGQSLGERLYAGMTGKVDDIITYIDTIANRTDTAGERTVEARKLDAYLSGADNRRTAINRYTLSGSGIVSKIESVINGFADTINQISANATALKRQMAVTANAAADKYYEVQRQYYNNTSNTTTVSKPVTVNMTVNFNDKVNSPVEVRRQMEEVSQQLAKEIMNGW